MRGTPLLPLLCLVTAALLIFAAPAGTAATLRIACSALGQEFELCREGAQSWARATGNQVELVAVPNSASERLALFQQLLAARAPDIDVLQIDVVWSGILGGHLVDLSPWAAQRAADHFPSVMATASVDGRLVALPWYADVGLLYYRKDLLERYQLGVPDTWAQLTHIAKRIQEGERSRGNEKMWGYVWQGRAYEGLTCNALEWIASRGGGSIVNAQGDPDIDNAPAREALAQAAQWVDTISPRGVLNYAEEEARALFQSGNAVFMRNWPYAWALANGEGSPVRGKVGIAALPAGAPGMTGNGTLGGGLLAVSRYSSHTQTSVDLVLFLTAAAEQKRRALAASYNPTLRHLYNDRDILRGHPLLARLAPMIEHAVARPSPYVGTRYNQVSAKFWSAVHRVLSGDTSAQAALADLQRNLRRLQRVGRW